MQTLNMIKGKCVDWSKYIEMQRGLENGFAAMIWDVFRKKLKVAT